MQKDFTLLLAPLLILPVIAACDDDCDPCPTCDPMQIIEQRFETSLHATSAGMETWYVAENGGFEQLTGVDYDSLACSTCHDANRNPDWTEPGCSDCHTSPGDRVPGSVCLPCHGRQNAEINNPASPGDIHRDLLRMDCVECHRSAPLIGDEYHGDGNTYASMWDVGAMKTKCSDCHSPLPVNTAHETHGATVDCSACHMKASLSCLNCHFDTEVGGGGKVAHRQVIDWIYLVNRNGKVHAGTIMTLKYQDRSFAVIAPYYAHTISEEARDCDDCHMAEALWNYNTLGEVQLLEWNSETSRLDNMPGVIPVPPDYQDVFKVDFVDWDGSSTDKAGKPVWTFMEAGPDLWQMIDEYASPLTQEQFDGLNRFAVSLHSTSEGMREWYRSENGGFELDTGIGYNDLACRNCHDSSNPDWFRPGCYDCHDEIGDFVEDSTCLPCHGRQNAEIVNGPGDAHRDALDFECTTCHEADPVALNDEFHGDGTFYRSMWQVGAMNTSCDDCHDPAALADTNRMHRTHLDGIDCSACHMQSAMSCLNCHFDREISGEGKFAARQVHDWKYLINRNGKVYPGTLMTLKYQDDSFAVIAPFYGHTISRTAIQACEDCHGNANVQAIEKGSLDLVTWNAGTGSLDTVPGIIPVPPDYRSVFSVDFADWDGNAWVFMENGPDRWQMIDIYGSALTSAQMASLAIPVTGTP